MVLDLLYFGEVAGPRSVGSTSETRDLSQLGRKGQGFHPQSDLIHLHACLLSGTR